MAPKAHKVPGTLKFFGLVMLAALAAYALYLLFVPPMPDASWEPASITVPKGASTSSIARLLAENKVIRHRKAFRLSAAAFGLNRKLKAGRYRFDLPQSVWQALMKLRAGSVAYHQVTVPEGLTMRRIAGIIGEGAGTDSLELLRLCADPGFLKSKNMPAKSLEGYLFPDTYDFEWATPPGRVLDIMLANFRAHVDSSWLKELAARKLTLQQAVIMASLVESEAQVDSERVLIASVFYNRIRLWRPLESCATIEYVLPRRKNTKLTYKDLEIDSPYNTYKKLGLPPGPICNPGRQSLEAAVFPAKTDYLYFVSRGDGGHIFSRTLEEHIRAKNICEKLKGR